MTASVSAKPETRNRAEIPAEYKWDFTPIYASWEAWEAGIKDMEAKMDAFPALKGTLSGGPDAVVKAYQLFDEIGQLQYRVFRYPQLQRDVDMRNNEIGGKLQRVQAIFAKFGTATSWFTPELLTIPQATMEKWIAETPALAPYKFPILDNYRQQEHVLDEKGERLLSFASRFSQVPRETFQELSTSDIKFPTVTLSDGKEVKLSPGAYQHVLQTNRNQADRKLAFETYHKTYEANINTYAAIYNGVLQRDWFSAQARNYPTTLDAALDGNAIPKAVVENLIATTRAGTEPFRRYMRLRKKLLGLETYNPFDNAIPIYDVEKKYPYELATELALKSVEPLGAEYVEKYKKFVSGGRIDVYENEGKRSGAYCAGVYGVGPYLLLNHNDTLDSVFTFAHEAGHAMHTVLSYESQPFVTSDYTIFVAEVASTTNERFLLEQFLATTTDPKERFVLLQHAVDAIVGTFYTQVMFADYELQAHRLVEEGKPVTAEVLSGIYKQLLKDYYGDAANIEELYRVTWARIPHFFNSPYYVYQYATCFASSAQIFKTLTTGSAEEKKAATERYLTLLRSGGNDHPMEQLKKAGVDLTKKETVQAVVEQMNELVAQLEAEAAKIK
ncbi:oligoendopeptidase F [Nibricoccus aquaticus]|uniref:Oligopeptidase F n=1 Tax=Nibricoccus aquaticus TaxID=2576891 RepID=A0A290Q9N6_9BACT|nr:oligoendopeptidase F [Nibricoccus aquaticus]ATC64977.1 oligoendopeptidase F [Nibricoccus aquaticus]